MIPAAAFQENPDLSRKTIRTSPTATSPVRHLTCSDGRHYPGMCISTEEEVLHVGVFLVDLP